MLKDNIKKARLDAGLTQLEVAEKLGVAQAQYARWENGGRNPKDETVEKLAEIFGTSFVVLKGRDDGLEEIVSLLREYELTEDEKSEIISLLQNFLINKSNLI
ncbi:helix-turn-helix transcriptional regulator [Streptococcus parasanguinis]|jgi:cryptic phage CTXphi transcriptional repressor rstR|uniref:helix-turn-helix transcriptional regulator n=1 Tax=Streptococcus parasanguinis TaxID=1318 RepID=UPI0009C29405|nr:helix-turn-helix transcriptional regulator [Streptococcus parasanguinis]ARC34653.1 XRE family transcriptional regulator [Streptococcus equinus]MCP9069005.1 helix-turn-helix domain-containing protein [Streptococcus parasanguinis]